MKSFCITKETIDKMKRPLTELEELFGSHIHDKGLISKIYREPI